MSLSTPRPDRRAWTRSTPIQVLALCAGLLGPSVLGAQVVVVDDGSFAIFRDSARVGREDFSIRLTRGSGGSAYVAQGTRLDGERRTAVALSTDSAGSPVRFQLEAREGSQLVLSYAGELLRGIWSGRALEASGESARETRLAGSRILVEPGIIHQLWFVIRAGERGPVTVFVPRTLAEAQFRVFELAPDRVNVRNQDLAARHWEIRPATGGPVRWEVWTDAIGRVLRVVDVAAGIEARRDEPPR